VQTQLACERLKAQGSRLAARAHPDSGSMGHAGSRIIIDGEACDARQVKALLLGLKRHNEELQVSRSKYLAHTYLRVVS